MRNHLNPLDLHWKTLDFGYEKSSQSIGFTLENIRFWYGKSSQPIGVALGIMRFCMRKQLNSLDLH